MSVLWILVILLVLFALIGGLAITKFLFILLVVALVLALFAGRA